MIDKLDQYYQELTLLTSFILMLFIISASIYYNNLLKRIEDEIRAKFCVFKLVIYLHKRRISAPLSFLRQLYDQISEISKEALICELLSKDCKFSYIDNPKHKKWIIKLIVDKDQLKKITKRSEKKEKKKVHLKEKLCNWISKFFEDDKEDKPKYESNSDAITKPHEIFVNLPIEDSSNHLEPSHQSNQEYPSVESFHSILIDYSSIVISKVKIWQ